MKKYHVELQLLRDMRPRSIPTTVEFQLPSRDTWQWKLYPGAAASPGELIEVVWHWTGAMTPEWAIVHAGFKINGVSFSAVRPGALYLPEADVPSLVVHYPIMAGPDNLVFSGWHTLLGRCRVVG